MSSEFIVTTTPDLTAQLAGDALELRPRGSWVAANAAALERLSNNVVPQLDRSDAIKLNMAEVHELDTLGAWLLEKISRRVTAAGHRADVLGVADNYAGLIEEVRQVNRRMPRPLPALQPARGESQRYRPFHDRRERGRVRISADAGFALPCDCSACCAGRDRCG